ncbi:MAG: ankyrin repeat domain-containing protein, partial [Chlamydiales bacterium]|nr:ankyrin repeat domain-containing protein [Chlamydiales bacterium]
NGANVHEPHQSGITPLHIAALNGHLEIVELLLMHNANPNSTTNTGVTALDFAKEKNHQKIVAVLSNLT